MFMWYRMTFDGVEQSYDSCVKLMSEMLYT